MKMQVRTFLAIGSWALLAVAVAHQQRSFQGKRSAPLSKEQRIKAMHAGFQTALEDLSMTKLRTVPGTDSNGNPTTYRAAPVFGLKRTPTLPVLHDGVIRDSDVPIMFGGDNWTIDYFAVSTQGKPLREHKMQFHPEFGSFAARKSDAISKDVVRFADKALPTFAKGDVYTGKVEGLEAQARPLRLTKSECLPCHKESRRGDPVAILVYVVRKSNQAQTAVRAR